MPDSQIGCLILTEKEDFSINWSTLLGVPAIALSFLVIGLAGSNGGFRGIKPLRFIELIAVADTIIVACLYFVELFLAVKKKAYSKNELALIVAMFWGFSLVVLSLAGYCLLQPEDRTILTLHPRTLYLISVSAGFLILTLCDAVFAYQALDYRKTRDYWTLFVFGDFPTLLSAILLLLYFTRSSGYSVTETDLLISGVLIGQMLFANILVLMGTMNLHYWLLQRLCKNCTS